MSEGRRGNHEGRSAEGGGRVNLGILTLGR